MSSAEITTLENAGNKPAFPLSPEMRVKVYEELLIHPHRSLKPNGFARYKAGRPYREKDYILTNILRTCRTFYEEALPILYGKNTLEFHDNNFSKPVLPFPEGHLAMVKRVKVDISPSIYSSAEKMGGFLMTLGTFGANIVHLSIRIHMLEQNDEFVRENHDKLPPLHLFDQCLVGDHPIVLGLFSLMAVKELFIEMEDEARFEPGVAKALKWAFMKWGTAGGRSITIEKGCTFPHEELDEEGPCPGCENTEEDFIIGTANWEYKDDMLTRRAVAKFLFLGGNLKKRKRTKANSTTKTVIKLKQSEITAAATKPTATAKKTKAKSAKASSKGAV
ncbi:MAG: hypothetical protein ASARMPREDX12_003443 [Alectoria sarmentosa]|nr:MAG: hypothetical protein ASARMPREDX12_003443 [Alectoria sarmentosa]